MRFVTRYGTVADKLEYSFAVIVPSIYEIVMLGFLVDQILQAGGPPRLGRFCLGLVYWDNGQRNGHKRLPRRAPDSLPMALKMVCYIRLTSKMLWISMESRASYAKCLTSAIGTSTSAMACAISLSKSRALRP